MLYAPADAMINCIEISGEQWSPQTAQPLHAEIAMIIIVSFFPSEMHVPSGSGSRAGASVGPGQDAPSARPDRPSSRRWNVLALQEGQLIPRSGRSGRRLARPRLSRPPARPGIPRASGIFVAGDARHARQAMAMMARSAPRLV